MPAITMSRAGPIRTAKTPKRVRFAGEDRDQTRLIRKQEAEKRDARNIPRVDVDVTTSYEIPALSAAAGALFGYAKSKLESAKWKLGTAVEYGKSALTSSFTSSFGKISLSFTGEKDQTAPAQQQQASMLEYPPFLAGATPNVVKRNRRDYYQSIGVMSSMKKAKSYAPGSTPARTPDHMQSDKEKNWYRFHETPYAGHKLDFGRGRSLTSLPPPSKPEYRFESPTRNAPKRKTPRSSAKKQQKSALKRRSSKAKLGEAVSRRSNAEEFHANFSGRERNELYASYTRFLTAIRFDVKRFAKDLREMRLPTDTILTIHESMKRSDWDFFMRIMADEEYWGQVKGVGSTKVPVVPQYVEQQPKRGKVFPCEYCRSHNWAGKVEVREIENEGDEIPVHGHTKFDEPYTKEELAHIDAGRYYKVFHRFCHESRYDWKFPDPGRPCSWEGQNHSAAKEGEWSISKYDPRLRHFPLYMQKVPKRVRQIQQDLQDMVTILTAQDRAAWLYIQGIRRHNTRMATLLEKMDLERKRRQVYWPCQMQVQVHVKNKLQPEPVVIEIVDEEPAGSKNKRAHSPTIEEIDPEMNRATSKRQRFLIDKPDRNYRPAYVEDVVDDSEKQQPEENPEEDSRKRTRSEDDEMDDTRMDKRAHTRKNHNRTPPSSFGLFSDEETEDDEQTERVKEWERQQTSKEKGKATMPQSEPKPEPQQEQPKLTWLQKLDAAMKQREAELAAQEAENAKIEAEKAAAKPPAPKPADTVPSILSNKPVLPAFPTTAPAPAPAKPFVFEDPSPTQEQTIPTDDGRNPLKEHTNGVKPSSPAASIPNLFGSAVPNLAPPGFNLGQNNAVSPLKPTGASTSAMFGSGKTGNVGLFGNEENIPTATAATQVTAPAPAAPAPVAPVAPAATVPSLFAPKAPEPAAAAPAFMFGAPAAPASSTAPSTNLFSSAPAPAPAAVPTASETKPTFSLFPTKKEEPKESAEASAAPKTAAPSIFAGLSAAPAATATTSSFVFGAKPAEAAPATSTLFSKPADAAAGGNLFAKPAETNLFAKPAEAAPTSLFAKALETASTNLFAKPTDAPQASNLFPKPAEAAATGLFSKPTGTATTSNLFGNIGGVSAAPVTTTAGPSSVLFGATAPAPAPAPATTTSGLFGAAPATAPVEPPKAFLFGSNTATAPKVDFGIKPTPSTQFDFAGAAKPAGSAPTAFTFGAGVAKPAEPTPAATLFANPTTTSAPSTGITTSGIFTSGATTTAAPAMTTSFPTSNSPFIFGGPPAAPATSMSQSFPPTTPQAPPPSMLFGGFKVQDSPTKQSPGNKFNEDISMASPEQSPEKPSPKTPLFGAATNGIANGMANGNPFNQNKPLFAAAPAAPSPLGKFNFPSAPQPAAPPALSFGTAVSQPGVSMPTTTTTSMATAPVNFSFGNGSFQSMPASMPGVPAPVASQALAPAAAAAPKFQFDATEINLNMNSPSARRPIATPRRRGGKR